jgi:hypothetical protein
MTQLPDKTVTRAEIIGNDYARIVPALIAAAG